MAKAKSHGRRVPVGHEVAQLLQGNCADAARGLSSKVDCQTIVDDMKALSVEQVEESIGNIWEKIQVALDSLGDEDDGASEIPGLETAEEVKVFIKDFATVLRAYLKICEERTSCTIKDNSGTDEAKAECTVPETVENAVIDLTGEVLLSCEDVSLQDAVANLSLEYFTMGCNNAIMVCGSLGPYLLWRVLDGNARITDVKRLYKSCSTFQVMDLEADESQATVDLMMRLCIHPNVLRISEGRSCIASFFNLGSHIGRDIILTMKELAISSEPICDSGDIIYKAWSNAFDENKEYIEQECIQPLIDATVKARTLQLHKNLTCVLSGLHTRKSEVQTEEMLHRMYQPILWPCLNATNGQVRRNAFSLLLEAFPVMDAASRSDKEHAEQQLTMQMTHIIKGLRDDNPAVRTVVAFGACKALCKYWEFVNRSASAMLSKLLTQLHPLVFDSASAKTRVAALEGLTILIENPHAQQVIKPLLPTLRPLLFDTNVGVRIAAVELVQHVARIRALKWWEMFPPEDLTAVMGSDCREVADVIYNMLFFQLVDGKELNLQECAELLQIMRDSSAAGAACCRILAERSLSDEDGDTSLGTLCTFASQIASYLIQCTIREERKTAQAPLSAHEESRIGRRKKRTAEEAVEAEGAWETADGWTGLVLGLQALVEPIYTHCRTLADNAATAEKPKKKKKEKEGLKNRAASKSSCLKEAEIAQKALDELLCPEFLTQLLHEAPTLQALHAIFKMAASSPQSKAAQALAQHCIGSMSDAVFRLPKNCKAPKKQININCLPCSGRLTGSSAESVATVCVMVDMALVCNGTALVETLCRGLGKPAEAEASAPQKKPCRPVNGKKHSSKDSQLNGAGALYLTAMLLRPEANIDDIVRCAGLGDLVTALGNVVAGLAERVAGESVLDASEELHRMVLSCHYLHVASTCAVRVALLSSPDPQACVPVMLTEHTGVLKQVIAPCQSTSPPVTCAMIDDVCQVLSTAYGDGFEASSGSSKRARDIGFLWSTTSKSSVIFVLCNAAHDISVAAITAIDTIEKNGGAEAGDCCVDGLDSLQRLAAERCSDAWAVVESLMHAHLQFAMLHVGDPSMLQTLCLCTVECTAAVSEALEAIFRGLAVVEVQGCMETLMTLVGLMISVAQTLCHTGESEGKLFSSMMRLAFVVLTDFVSQEDRDDNEEATSLACTRASRQQQSLVQLLLATFSLLGYDSMQADETGSGVVDLATNSGWLFAGLQSLDKEVYSRAVKLLKAQIEQHISNSCEADDLDVQHIGCKLLLQYL